MKKKKTESIPFLKFTNLAEELHNWREEILSATEKDILEEPEIYPVNSITLDYFLPIGKVIPKLILEECDREGKTIKRWKLTDAVRKPTRAK